MAQTNDVVVNLVLQGADAFKNGANKALGSVSKSAGVGAKAFKAIGTAAVAASVAAVGAFVAISKNGVKVAADLESAKMGFVTLLGSAKKANDAIEMIKRDAAKTPFEITGLIAANQMLTQVTKNAGRSEALLLNVGKAISAAGKSGVELDRVIVNLQQIANTGKITEMDIRQFGFAGINILELLAAYYGTTKDKAVEMVKNSKNAFADLEGAFEKAGMAGGQFANAFSNQAGTMNQLFSNLKDSWNIFTADFVQTTGIFDIVKNAVTKFTETLNWIQTVLPGIIEQGKSKWNEFISAFTNSTFFEYVKVQFGLFKAMWDGLVAGFGYAWQLIQPLLQTLGESLSKMFGTAATEGSKFKITFETVGKAIGIVVGGIVLAIVGIVTAIVKVNDALLWIIGKIQGARIAITNAFKSIGSSIAAAFKNAINSAIIFMNNGLNRIIGAYNSIPILGDIPPVNIPRFAQGGIVGGSSTSGDKVLARVNSGEMVLTRGQQSNLFNLLKNLQMNQNIAFNAPISFGGQASPMQQENQFVNLLMNIAR